MSIYLLATLDTKGAEAAFVRDRLRELGLSVTLVDTGCLGSPTAAADIPREAVFAAAGASLESLRAAGDRGQAVTQAAVGAAQIVSQDYAAGKLEGVLALGGSAGTTIGAAAMRALPLGVPKLMVSTLASGQVRHYVADKDICMLNSVVDIAGLNRISRKILAEAAAAMAGMVKFRVREVAAEGDRPLIAATMFGVTTPCVQHARSILESAGYEVLVFHATGNGGQAMESLIDEGLIAGVLDLTTTELADELVGGVLSAGPERLTAAGRRAIPQVISVGALDMVNFGGMRDSGLPEGAAEKFRDRRFYRHNPSVTLMRTTPEENATLGAEIARKASQARGPTAICLPLAGVSAIDADGKPFDDPAARRALFDAIRSHSREVQVVEVDCHINDPRFAERASGLLLEMLQGRRSAAATDLAGS